MSHLKIADPEGLHDPEPEILRMFGAAWCRQAVVAGRRWLRGKKRDELFTRAEVEMIVVLEEAHASVEGLNQVLRRSSHG